LKGSGGEGEGPISLRVYGSSESAGCILAMGRIEGGLYWRGKGYSRASSFVTINTS